MSSVQMYQNLIGRVAQRSYFGAIVLGPLPTQRWKVLFHSIMSSIRIPVQVGKIEVKGGGDKYIRRSLGVGGG